MNENAKAQPVSKTPTWFSAVNVLALLWNLMGLAAFVAIVALMGNEAALAELPEDQQELYRNQPMWVTIAFAAAVLGGSLGSLGLVLHKAWAFPVLLISLAGVLLQDLHTFVLSDTIEVMGGPSAAVFPLIILLIAIALVPYSRMGISKGWLR